MLNNYNVDQKVNYQIIQDQVNSIYSTDSILDEIKKDITNNDIKYIVEKIDNMFNKKTSLENENMNILKDLYYKEIDNFKYKYYYRFHSIFNPDTKYEDLYLIMRRFVYTIGEILLNEQTSKFGEHLINYIKNSKKDICKSFFNIPNYLKNDLLINETKNLYRKLYNTVICDIDKNNLKSLETNLNNEQKNLEDNKHNKKLQDSEILENLKKFLREMQEDYIYYLLKESFYPNCVMTIRGYKYDAPAGFSPLIYNMSIIKQLCCNICDDIYLHNYKYNCDKNIIDHLKIVISDMLKIANDLEMNNKIKDLLKYDDCYIAISLIQKQIYTIFTILYLYKNNHSKFTSENTFKTLKTILDVQKIATDIISSNQEYANDIEAIKLAFSKIDETLFYNNKLNIDHFNIIWELKAESYLNIKNEEEHKVFCREIRFSFMLKSFHIEDYIREMDKYLYNHKNDDDKKIKILYELFKTEKNKIENHYYTQKYKLNTSFPTEMENLNIDHIVMKCLFYTTLDEDFAEKILSEENLEKNEYYDRILEIILNEINNKNNSVGINSNKFENIFSYIKSMLGKSDILTKKLKNEFDLIKQNFYELNKTEISKYEKNSNNKINIKNKDLNNINNKYDKRAIKRLKESLRKKQENYIDYISYKFRSNKILDDNLDSIIYDLPTLIDIFDKELNQNNKHLAQNLHYVVGNLYYLLIQLTYDKDINDLLKYDDFYKTFSLLQKELSIIYSTIFLYKENHTAFNKDDTIKLLTNIVNSYCKAFSDVDERSAASEIRRSYNKIRIMDNYIHIKMNPSQREIFNDLENKTYLNINNINQHKIFHDQILLHDFIINIKNPKDELEKIIENNNNLSLNDNQSKILFDLYEIEREKISKEHYKKNYDFKYNNGVELAVYYCLLFTTSNKDFAKKILTEENLEKNKKYDRLLEIILSEILNENRIDKISKGTNKNKYENIFIFLKRFLGSAEILEESLNIIKQNYYKSNKKDDDKMNIDSGEQNEKIDNKIKINNNMNYEEDKSKNFADEKKSDINTKDYKELIKKNSDETIKKFHESTQKEIKESEIKLNEKIEEPKEEFNYTSKNEKETIVNNAKK